MSIANQQRNFYEQSFERHGDNSTTFLHKDQVQQYERFLMLTRCFSRETGNFSVHEIGCSLGHFGEFLKQRFPSAEFSGSDICKPFVIECRRRFPDGEFFLRDVTEKLPEDRYDFVVICGTFNVPLGAPKDEWQEFIFSMLTSMYAMSRKGISATFLTTYYDPGRDRPELYYQDEKRLLDFVAGKLSRHFELDYSGPLYEYATNVYRPEYIRSLRKEYGSEDFARYFRTSK